MIGKRVRILDLEDPDDSAIRAAGGPWNPYGPIFYVEDAGFIVREKHYPYVTTATVLAAADVASLEMALGGWGDSEDTQESIFLAEEDGRPFHPMDSDWIRGLFFGVRGGHLVGVIEDNFRDEVSVPEGLKTMCDEALAEHECLAVAMDPHTEWSNDSFSHDWLLDAYPNSPDLLEQARAEIVATQAAQPRTVRVTFRLATEGGSARDLVEAGRDLQELLRAHSRGGGISATTVRAWLRAGRFSLLKGLPESEWLEIKSQSYQLGKGTPGPVRNQAAAELAQDVARFANAPEDALLILGYSESKQHGQDVVGDLRAVDFNQVNVLSYRDILDARIVPPLAGVTIELLESKPGRGVVLIFVPKQAPEMKPYLVHGAIAEGKYEGDFFSIVERRGEGSMTTTAQQIHAYIVAGRRYLEGL